MDVARRLKFGLVALGAVLVSAFTAAPALADTQPDPTESNIPYLAWRGEQVRLVKCHPSISPTGAGQRADLILVDWSGEEHALATPHFESSTGGFLLATGPDRAGQGCVAGSFSSQKAGLAQIKLVVSTVPATTAGATQVFGGSFSGPVGTPLLKHDFLVGWMNLNPPVLSASNAGATGPGPITTNPADLIDIAGGAPNNFRVDVTGNIPLRANFRELGLGDTLTMPTDWPRLAQVFGTYFNPDNPNPGFLWDIHDDRTTAEGHSQGGLTPGVPGAQSICPPFAAAGTTAFTVENGTFFDAVDNCPQLLTDAAGALRFPTSGVLGPELGAFSRVWQQPTNPTIGPFDPLVPSQTLLSDGRLNSEDAPMPAARIDFTTSGGGFFGCVGSTTVLGPIGGPDTSPSGPVAACSAVNPALGALLPSQRAKDKHVLYSRDGTGVRTAAAPNQHNLYAPFYGRFIPATARATSTIATDPGLPRNFVPVAEASGSEGPAGSVIGPGGAGPGFTPVPGGTNNFNGYLVNGLYHYWDIARVLNSALGGNSTCLLRQNTAFVPVPGGSALTGPFTVVRTPVFRQLTSGPQTVVIYTDEHGEGHVFWYPGTGFNFGALGIAGNLNLGCELQNVNPLARPNIQAIARYPYQPVTDAAKVSNVITKTVNSSFNKIVRCVPKGTNPNDQFAQICLAEARDINGLPGAFVGEIVCFASNAELIQHFTGSTGAVLGGGGITVAGTLLTPAEQAALGKAGAAVLCQRLDAAGRAAVEVFGKGPSNVIVDFVDEGLIRVVTFNFASGTGATGTSEATGTTAPTPAQIEQVNTAQTTVQTPTTTITNNGGTPEISTAKPEVQKVAYSWARSPELVRPVKGKPYLLVHVKGPAGKVKLRIRMVGARATIATVDRLVSANKLTKITGLKIANSVTTIRVAIVSS